MKNKYPKGLLSLSLVNTGNIIAVTTINAVLVLYCTQALGMTAKNAYALYAAFGAIFYSASLLGGFLGGRYDYTLSFLFGSLLAICGGLILSLSGAYLLNFGLSAIIIGCGLIVPNLYCLINKIFDLKDPSRENGFRLMYISANVAGMLIAFLSGLIVRAFGYHAAFGLLTVSVVLTLVVFLMTLPRLKFTPEKDGSVYAINFSSANMVTIAFVALVSMGIVSVLLNYARASNILLTLAGIVVLCSILLFAFKEKTAGGRKKLFAFFIFLVIGMSFWILYMMLPSAMMVFIQDNVNRHIGHFILPASSIYALSPGFIILTGLIVNFILFQLSKRNRVFSVPGKFATGITLAGMGYLALVVGIYFASQSGLVALGWVVLSYFLQSFGELLIGPTSYSMVGTLCPTYLEGFMMGAYRLSIGTAGAISCFLAGATAAPKGEVTPVLTNPIFAHQFGLYGTITLIIGAVTLLLVPKFKKLWV